MNMFSQSFGLGMRGSNFGQSLKSRINKAKKKFHKKGKKSASRNMTTSNLKKKSLKPSGARRVRRSKKSSY